MPENDRVTPGAATADKGALIVGRYRIGDQIGRGGMGGVYAGDDEVLKREVAIKILKPELANDPEILERFRREALIAARLSHNGIAQVLDFVEEDGRSYLIMELLKGRDLALFLSEDGPLDPASAADIARRVAEALHHAHEFGAVHRDVNPGNIYLTDSGNVKVTDFGIATATEQAPLTKTGDIMGTAFYLSPEQVRGMPATAASDVYALGCVLYEMVTGRPPFSAETSVATALARLDKEPPRASDLVPETPPSLENVIQRALAQEPADRFPSAAAMADALADISGPPTARMTRPIGSRTEVLRPGEVVERSVEKLKEKVEPAKRPWAAVAAVAFALFLIVLLARACGSEPTQTTNTASVANVVSLPFEEAKSKLEKEGLVVQKGSEALSDEQAGHVFAQDPPAGASLDKGAAVTLSVSLGEGVSVPSLTNLRLEQAAEKLRDAGLTGVVTSRVAGSETGVVAAQDPPAGAMAARGTRVSLTMTQQASNQDADGQDGQDGEAGDRGERGKGRDGKR